jgi:hypothetical protein
MVMNKLYTEEEVRLIIEGAIAEEREACAEICKAESEYAETWGTWGQVMTADKCATAIRKRGQE